MTGTIKRIHVDQHVIRRNKKRAAGDPPEAPLTVQNRGRSTKAHHVAIDGPSELVWSDKALSCGAHCWIETRAVVRADGEVID